MKQKLFHKESIFLFLFISIFFLLYSTLSVVRHLHYGSFGFDLGISDQIVWKYSQFKQPLMSIIAYTNTPAYTDHFEPIYLFIASLYWIFRSPIALLILQSFLICLSAVPVYVLARRKQINILLSFVLLFAYLTFYGIQHAVWFDVHTIVFGAVFLPWFIYFMEVKRYKLAVIPFLFALIAKEDVGMLLFLISIVFSIFQRKKEPLYFASISVIYSFALFFVYFPFLTADGYRYAGEHGLLNSLNLTNYINSSEKRSVYFYSLGWFGFLPLISPLFLLPAFGDITKYFVIADNLPATHGLFMHYRVTLAMLLVWPAIATVSKIKKMNHWVTAVIIFGIVLYLNYSLHVPLTYLSKRWFWTPPQSSKTIHEMIQSIDATIPIAVQNNLVPHLSQRDVIVSLWYEEKEFPDTSLCGKQTCEWLRWNGNPTHLLVDLSPEWDIRHFLADREAFIKALEHLEKQGVIQKEKELGTTVLYILQNNQNSN